MRRLVECSECSQQYDATRRRIGSRFRCHCGSVLTVEQPTGHDAAVVRCSACGAARAGDDGQCPYCDSEFTLHERDLHTVCPRCLAIVSDRARFCHHCGIGLVAALDAGTPSESRCPACQDDNLMVSRRIGTLNIALLECGRCAGFWMGHKAFRQLVEQAQREALPKGTIPESPQEVAAMFGLPADSVAPAPQRKTTYYRPCVVCGEMMNRRLYGTNSGVILDSCKDHGIWFDAEELARILVWLRAGGETESRSEVDRTARANIELARARAREPKTFFEAVLESLLGVR
jgi:Zn-finger nucleic acid-binding protein